MKPLIIGICGIQRSGSTVQYNLVRIALEMAGYDVKIFVDNYNPNRSPKNGETYLCKSHRFSQRLAKEADYIFLTDRSDEDILASFERFGGKRPTPERFELFRKYLYMWRKKSDQSFIFDYKTWEENSFLYIDDIVNILCLPIDSLAVLKEFNNIELPESGQDSETLFYHNHITSESKG